MPRRKMVMPPQRKRPTMQPRQELRRGAQMPKALSGEMLPIRSY
jgi:hypothetical protein